MVDRIVGRHLVEIGAGGQPAIVQFMFPPAARAPDPFARLDLLHPRDDGFLDVGDGMNVGEIRRRPTGRAPGVS